MKDEQLERIAKRAITGDFDSFTAVINTGQYEMLQSIAHWHMRTGQSSDQREMAKRWAGFLLTRLSFMW